jgi:hypothetical protein
MRISVRVSAIAANYEVEFLKRLKQIIKLHILQVMCSLKSDPLDKREERGTIAKEKKAKELRYSPITVLLIAPHDNSPTAQLAGARDDIREQKTTGREDILVTNSSMPSSVLNTIAAANPAS